jgi:hypothetical protein
MLWPLFLLLGHPLLAVVNGFCVVSFLTLVSGLACAIYGFLQLRAGLGHG